MLRSLNSNNFHVSSLILYGTVLNTGGFEILQNFCQVPDSTGELQGNGSQDTNVMKLIIGMRYTKNYRKYEHTPQKNLKHTRINLELLHNSVHVSDRERQLKSNF